MADTTLAIPQEITDLPNAERRGTPVVPPNVINGTDGGDIIATTAQDDIVNALAGNDIIKGSKGNDLIIGGQGKDTVDYQIFLANGNYASNDDITELFAIKANGSLDLIAKIAYAQGSSSTSQRQASAFALTDATVDPLLTNTTFSLSQGQSFGIFTAAVA